MRTFSNAIIATAMLATPAMAAPITLEESEAQAREDIQTCTYLYETPKYAPEWRQCRDEANARAEARWNIILEK
jgi:hypothetical protein